MRVLIISYRFPPQNLISSLRIGKLAKYLPAYGWEPWVITLGQGIFPSIGELPIEMPPEHIIRADLGRVLTSIVRNRQFRREPVTELDVPVKKEPQVELPLWRDLRKWVWRLISAQISDVRFPDRALPWCLPAIKKGSTLLKEQSFDVIFSSHGPSSSHLVASVLAKRFGLPWVADYRDLWSQNHIERRSRIFQWIETCLEQWVIRRAIQLTTVSEPLAQQLRELHHKPVTVLMNGFDEEDFEVITPTIDSNKFTIVYTGILYPGKRDPSIVFEAIRNLMDRYPHLSNVFELHFFGSDAALLRTLSEKFNVQQQVVLHPRVANHVAIQWQMQADMLLLLEWTDPSAKGVYTGKIFEYLGARKPILATGASGGVIESLLKDSGGGVLIGDPKDAAQEILHWFEVKQCTGTTRLRDRQDLLRPYTRRYQAGKLAAILQSAFNSGRTTP